MMHKIKINVTLTMTDEQLRAWANEYGLSDEETPADATKHLGELVHATVADISQMKDFASIARFTVKGNDVHGR